MARCTSSRAKPGVWSCQASTARSSTSHGEDLLGLLQRRTAPPQPSRARVAGGRHGARPEVGGRPAPCRRPPSRASPSQRAARSRRPRGATQVRVVRSSSRVTSASEPPWDSATRARRKSGRSSRAPCHTQSSPSATLSASRSRTVSQSRRRRSGTTPTWCAATARVGAPRRARSCTAGPRRGSPRGSGRGSRAPRGSRPWWWRTRARRPARPSSRRCGRSPTTSRARRRSPRARRTGRRALVPVLRRVGPVAHDGPAYSARCGRAVRHPAAASAPGGAPRSVAGAMMGR